METGTNEHVILLKNIENTFNSSISDLNQNNNEIYDVYKLIDENIY